MLETILGFFKEHGTELLALWGGIITVATIVVKLTPNKKDDKILETILRILTTLSLNPNVKKIEEDAKEKAKEELKEELDEMAEDTTRDNLIDILR